MEFKKLFAELKENIEKTANVKALFGETRNLKGLQIIPVASIKLKGGGGGGTGEAEEEETEEKEKNENEAKDKEYKKHPMAKGHGGGMGLNVEANPVGFIKIQHENAVFVEIIDKTKLIMKGLKIFGTLLIISSIKSFFKRKKKK